MLESGTRLGHFTVLSRIGAGGMGEVYRARDERLEREVAIKVLPAEVARDPDHLARFGREARVLARLSHPGILAIHELAEEGGIAYVVTELLRGETLQERLGQGEMSWRQALEIGASVLDGLAAAHVHGVIHRDIKPSNVFLTDRGAVKLLDFGLARIQGGHPRGEQDVSGESTLTQKGGVLGTPGYMSPEQVRGRTADARSDLFSFGCMLHEMLTGHAPFKRDSPVETLAAILNEEPPEVSMSGVGASPELNRLLRRCLEKSPALRFQSAGDLANALRSLLESTPSGGTVITAAGACPFVAVLPFANLTADPDQEYFCDGMTEEIINALAQVSGLRVVARTSAFAFKNQLEDVREIGRRLDVGAVVEGSVRRAGDRLRVTAQLIDARSGLHLWSQRFDRTLEDVFAIQDEISLAVVDRLQVELLGRERAAVTRRPTKNLEAYNACLKGWFHWNSLTPEGYQRSYDHFSEAIRLDPDLLWAYEGLTAWYLSQPQWGELPPEEMLTALEPLLQRVLAHGDTYLCHAMAGAKAIFERDWATVDERYRRALQLSPSTIGARISYAYTLLPRGRFDEAIELIREVQRLDPLSPVWTTWTSTWLVYTGAIDEGLAGLLAAVEMYPHHWMAHLCLSMVLSRTSRLEEARAHAEKAVELSGGQSRAVTQNASLCYLLDDVQRGDELVHTLEERARASYVPPTFFGWLHLARGESGEAVARFQEAARRKDTWVLAFRLDAPVPIPPDPRFVALAEELGLPT